MCGFLCAFCCLRLFRNLKREKNIILEKFWGSVVSRRKKEENAGAAAGYTFLSVTERLMEFLDGYTGISQLWLPAELDTAVHIVYCIAYWARLELKRGNFQILWYNKIW